MSILLILILKLFVDTQLALICISHSWRLLPYLLVNSIVRVILSSDSESLPLISLNMLTNILPASRAFKCHRLVPEDLLCSISLGGRVVKIIMLRALFIIHDFLISMLSLWSRARYTPV